MKNIHTARFKVKKWFENNMLSKKLKKAMHWSGKGLVRNIKIYFQ